MTYIHREIFEDVADHVLHQPEMTIITGSRQVGKTVLLEQTKEYLQQHGVSPDYMLSYNLDIVSDWEQFQDQTRFISYLQQRSQHNKLYVFVDEAQKATNAPQFFKGVYDSNLNVKLILTGSSSLEFKADLKESLAGRKRLFHLPPFTFLEFVRSKDERLCESLEQGTVHSLEYDTLRRFYEEYITFGGYPRVVLASSPKNKILLLREIYSSYIERDAIGLFAIDNKTAFIHLLRLLAAQTGQLVNIAELTNTLNIDRHTVQRYIQILEETFVIKTMTPYFTNTRQEIVKAHKIYFLDNGIRNTALDIFTSIEKRTDKGETLENAVAGELIFRSMQAFAHVHFWRTKQQTEVDFIIEQGTRLLALEVKHTVDTRKLSNLDLFMKKFSPKETYVITLNPSSNSAQKSYRMIHPFYLKPLLHKREA